MSLIIPEKKQRNPPSGGRESGITALIDGDIIAYSIGYACQQTIYEVYAEGENKRRVSFESKKELNEWEERVGTLLDEYKVEKHIEPEPLANCLHSVKVFLNGVLEATDAQYHKVYLTGKGNFRDEVGTILPYKGNRKQEPPIHKQAIRDYLVKQWDAEVIEGMEADDALSIEQTRQNKYASAVLEKCSTVICSIDKDLRNTPGWHYNWNKDDNPVWISEEEATYSFYKQLLTGDRTDNIQGIKGIGPKKAEKILEGCETEGEMYWATWQAYCDNIYGKPIEGEKHFVDDSKVYAAVRENAYLLWMVRELDENNNPIMWQPPC